MGESLSWLMISSMRVPLARNKMRGRGARALSRRRPQLRARDRVLIVSEGSKTEPNYFEDIRITYRLPTAEITVLPSRLGTEPRQVVDYAESIFRESRAYERIYAVFDRDDHRTYHDALVRASQLDGGILRNDERRVVRFIATPSVPCFELWLLLHFEDIRELDHRNQILRRLKIHIPTYEKGMHGAYASTQTWVSEATERAIRIRDGGDNPHDETALYTNVDELVSFLRSSIRPLKR